MDNVKVIQKEQAMKTPYYLIDQVAVDSNLKQLKQALTDAWGEHCVIGYSYKANALPWIVRHFGEQGCYAEVSSGDEFLLAEEVGVPANRVIYNGVIKTRESFETVLRAGGIVNIETGRELEWLAEMPDAAQMQVGIRVNFDLEKYCPGHSQCGEEGGRFGFCRENGELRRAIDRLQSTGAELAGLQLHCSSKTRAVEVYEAIADAACSIAEELQVCSSNAGKAFRFVDLGGGFFGGLPDKPQFEEYAERISARLRRCFSPEETTLIVEPGMALIGPFVSYHTSVIDVKDTLQHRYIVTDGSRTNIDPFFRKTDYRYRLETGSDEEPEKRLKAQVICGYTCMENDRLFTAADGPELQPGDRIIYEKVGAYTMCLTPLFIQWFPDVYVNNGTDIVCVRTRWGVREYTGHMFGG